MNNIEQIITAINMLVMVGLIITVALQRKGAGLSTVFGGSGSIAQTRRGFDKWLYYATITLAVLFVGLSVTTLLLNR